jgi:hypothetical protein
MFGTMRDGLRHLISKRASTDALSDRVLDRFPIHGEAAPRRDSPASGPVFEIDSSSRFDDDRWEFSGRIEPVIDEFEGWTAEISLTGIGEDGSRYEEIPVESLSVDDDVTMTLRDGTARLVADETATAVEFEGTTTPVQGNDPTSGSVGETRLQIRAELQTDEGEPS